METSLFRRKEKMRWIREDDYEKVMKTEVEPYVSQRKECGFDARVKGPPIY